MWYPVYVCRLLALYASLAVSSLILVPPLFPLPVYRLGVAVPPPTPSVVSILSNDLSKSTPEQEEKREKALQAYRQTIRELAAKNPLRLPKAE